MPNRIVREGINSSPRVNRLSMGAELLYRRLMSVVDDYGRFHASAVTIRGACWPTCPEKVTERQVSMWLKECCVGDRRLIRIYEVDGSRYLAIEGFGQQVRTKSKFPAPPEATDPDHDPGLLTGCDQSDSSLISDRKQNARASRSRIRSRISESESAANTEPEASAAAAPPDQAPDPLPEEPPPPTVTEIRQGITRLTQRGGNGNANHGAADSIQHFEHVRKSMMAYPDARKLPGKPDDVVVKKCLELASGDSRLVRSGFEAMFRANKRPASSWMWFPTVLAQYLQQAEKAGAR